MKLRALIVALGGAAVWPFATRRAAGGDAGDRASGRRPSW